MKLRRVTQGSGELYGVRFDCPGCGRPHVVRVAPSPDPWGFNGDFARPTLSPSVLVRFYEHTTDSNRETGRCHSFVRDGRIEFLGDCTHALKGQTVDLPDIEPPKETST